MDITAVDSSFSSPQDLSQKYAHMAQAAESRLVVDAAAVSQLPSLQAGTGELPPVSADGGASATASKFNSDSENAASKGELTNAESIQQVHIVSHTLVTLSLSSAQLSSTRLITHIYTSTPHAPRILLRSRRG